jgi:lipoprotein-releasing system permease protein
MQMERVAVFCVLSLILLIAIFNVFASLAMSVIERKQQTQILKAIGANNKMILKIYFYEGIIIGCIGTALGFLLGIGFIIGQINFH